MTKTITNVIIYNIETSKVINVMLAIAYKPMIVDPTACHEVDLQDGIATVYLTMSGFVDAYIEVKLTFSVTATMDRYEHDTDHGGYYEYDASIDEVKSANLFDEDQFCIGTVEVDDAALREIIQLIEHECDVQKYGENMYGEYCVTVRNCIPSRSFFKAV